MFDFVREFNGSNSVMVGREINGSRHSLYFIHVARTYDGREWCRGHGMKLIDRVPNIERTAWYEIWASDDLHLMTAFLI